MKVKIDDANKGFRIDFKKKLKFYADNVLNLKNFAIQKAKKDEINTRIFYDQGLMAQRTQEGDSRYIVNAECVEHISAIQAAQ